MFTRRTVSHAYEPHPRVQVQSPGLVRMVTHKGVVQTWAVVRPVSAPYEGMAPPMHVIQNQKINGPLARGGALGLVPGQPHKMADLSDHETWQRPYRFT